MQSPRPWRPSATSRSCAGSRWWRGRARRPCPSRTASRAATPPGRCAPFPELPAGRARIAPREAHHRAAALQGGDGAADVGVLFVTFEIRQADVVPGLLPAGARLDAREVALLGIEDVEHLA